MRRVFLTCSRVAELFSTNILFPIKSNLLSEQVISSVRASLPEHETIRVLAADGCGRPHKNSLPRFPLSYQRHSASIYLIKAMREYVERSNQNKGKNGGQK